MTQKELLILARISSIERFLIEKSIDLRADQYLSELFLEEIERLKIESNAGRPPPLPISGSGR